MAKTMLLKAKPGAKVPYPENSYKYLEGDEPATIDVTAYERLEYWHRRISDGDVEEITGADAEVHVKKAAARREKEEAHEKEIAEKTAAERKADAIKASSPETMVVKKSDGNKETV